MMKNIKAVKIASVALLLSGSGLHTNICAKDSQKTKRKPNVLLIIADDQGYADFGVFGGAADVHTPNLDNLAAMGTRFSNGYVTASISSPSRCGILTGRYQQRWGVSDYAATLPATEITIAEQLKAEGYRTCYIGKSHYGGAKKQISGIGQFWDNDVLVNKTDYSINSLTERCLDFIDRNKKHPFFLMVSFNAVHLFIHQLTKEQLEADGFKNVPDWNPTEDTYKSYLDWYVNTVKPNTPEGRKRYLIHLQELDKAVGKLIKKLKRKRILKNTLIIYLSDNGRSPRTYANNTLKGNKYILEEDGIRVPYLMVMPGTIPKGLVYKPMVSSLDIFPTIMSVIDVEMPSEIDYDGVNLIPFITNKNKKQPHEALYWTGGDKTGWAIRKGNWKLRYFGIDKKYELYNLATDISETKDLSVHEPEMLQEMKGLFFEWLKLMSDE